MTMLAAEENCEKAKKATKKLKIDINIEEMITFLKLLNTRMEDNAGKIIRLEISKVPMIRMPMTTTMAVKMAKRIL